jgi:hypothetical protein
MSAYRGVRWAARVPAFPALEVYYLEEQGRNGTMWFQYCGRADDLIAAGVATAEMLLINPRTGPRRKRLDADGDQYRVSRYWRSTTGNGESCEPYRFYCVNRSKTVERLGRLPGAMEAIASRKKYERYWAARRRGEPEPPVSRTHHLRLVVDNTRRTSREPR